MEPVITAGQAQRTYTENKRFHSDAWCFSDAQCGACFKVHGQYDTVGWLKEATCSVKTKHCYVRPSSIIASDAWDGIWQGFDGSSQVVAMKELVLKPLLLTQAGDVFAK
eukprot:scaffold666659_cov43-Prasinocladus_malaysianus.AAC.1